jgi:benzodiazapine receptor
MSSPIKQRPLIGLAVWLLLGFAVSTIGALASIQAAAFYSQLIQPSWGPSHTVFGPV